MSAAFATQPAPSLVELLDGGAVVGEPKRGARRFWTNAEEKTLRAAYPQGGVPACLPLLPGRTAAAIYGRAGQLSLTGPKRAPHDLRRQVWFPSEAIDAVIRRQYPLCVKKLDIVRLAKSLGRPRWWVSKRAAALGLVSPRFKEPPWSQAELDIVLAEPWRALPTLRRKLARAGFKRTETAIKVRLKRECADRQDPEHLTARGLAQLMGVDSKTVTGWIERGLLTAKRRGTTRTSAQGADHWWITNRAVKAFLVGNVAAYDLRKVDKFWFVDLLAGGGPSIAERMTAA